MAHRRAPQADADLDHIWYYTATESGSMEIADRLIDTITGRFSLLARHPHMGRARDDLKPGLRSFSVGEYVILYRGFSMARVRDVTVEDLVETTA